MYLLITLQEEQIIKRWDKMELLKALEAYYIVMITIFIITFISIITIAINSIIIATRLKKIKYKLIEIDYNNKQDASQICNEIRKIKP